jgi:hypothetical protein
MWVKSLGKFLGDSAMPLLTEPCPKDLLLAKLRDQHDLSKIKSIGGSAQVSFHLLPRFHGLMDHPQPSMRPFGGRRKVPATSPN